MIKYIPVESVFKIWRGLCSLSTAHNYYNDKGWSYVYFTICIYVAIYVYS